MSHKLKLILMSYIFVEQRASCFAGSAGNGTTFQHFKSWSSEQQFPHSEITSGPQWKPPTWSFITQAGFRKRPCRTSSLELPFFTAAFPSVLNLSSLHWGFLSILYWKSAKVQGTVAACWAPKGQGAALGPGVSEPAPFSSLSSVHLFLKALATASISCGFSFCLEKYQVVR